MKKHIGKRQREIIDVLKDGGKLYNEGGMWSLALWEESRHYSGRVTRDSAMGLYVRGLIYAAGTEDHPGYIGGYRTTYALTEEGKRL
jgi:hypothetical protein